MSTLDDSLGCERVHDVDGGDQCAFIRNNSECHDDENFLPYSTFVYCYFGSGNVTPALAILALWLVILFVGLGVTADDFLTPALIVISKSLRLSQNIAGVTFLAFGNGAPDIISSLAGVGQARPELVIGELFGAGIFVTCVVAGGICLTQNFKIMERPFLRDIIFYIAATYWAFCLFFRGGVTIFHSIGFICLYLLYIVVVVTSSLIYKRHKRKLDEEMRRQQARQFGQRLMAAGFGQLPSMAPLRSAVCGRSSEPFASAVDDVLLHGHYNGPLPPALPSGLSTAAAVESTPSYGGGASANATRLGSNRDGERQPDDPESLGLVLRRSSFRHSYVQRRKRTLSGSRSRPTSQGAPQPQRLQQPSGCQHRHHHPPAGGGRRSSAGSALNSSVVGSRADSVTSADHAFAVAGRPGGLSESDSSGGDPRGVDVQQAAAATFEAQSRRASDGDDAERRRRRRSPAHAASAAAVLLHPDDALERRLTGEDTGSVPESCDDSGIYGRLTGEEPAEPTDRPGSPCNPSNVPCCNGKLVSNGRGASSGGVNLSGLDATSATVCDQSLPRPIYPTLTTNANHNIPPAGHYGDDDEDGNEYTTDESKKGVCEETIEDLSPLVEFLTQISPIDKEDWADLNWFWRCFEILKAPVYVVLSLTVPVVDPDNHKNNWCRLLNVLHCVTSPLAILFNFGPDIVPVWIGGRVPLAGAVFACGCVLALLVLLTSKHDQPPAYHVAFGYAGFLVSICWIYMLANEVVSLLKTVGIVFNLSDAFLGMTVLAWGNSIGDFISNLAVARQGYPRMAISACFGGPLLNLLLGFGLPYTYKLFKDGISTFPLKYSNMIGLMYATLCQSLVSTMVVMFILGFDSRREFGGYLVLLYLIFFTVAAVVELMGIV